MKWSRLFQRKPSIPSYVLYEEREVDDYHKFPLGMADDAEISWDIRYCPHLLVTGGSGSGKTVLQRNLIRHTADYSEKWDTIVLDMESFYDVSQAEGQGYTFYEQDQLEEFIDHVAQETKKREALISEPYEAQDVGEESQTPYGKELLIVITEANELFSSPSYVDKFTVLLNKSQRLGIHFALIVYDFKPSEDDEDSPLKDIFEDNVVVCGNHFGMPVEQMKSFELAHNVTPVGRACYYRSGVGKAFQMFFTDPHQQA